ncbi:MAG TPA: sugar nucleotide-binding protein, partial [Bacteroidia bacterium]|nr:sugar nucleotide-binding protein [Bacteroidia bacterium]
MANATIAITGAGGFLGKALTALLKKNNFEVVSISRSYGIDITKAETLNTIPDFDCLIHLAAHTFVPDSYNNTAA